MEKARRKNKKNSTENAPFPPLYKVVLLYDGLTPMDFLVEVLKTLFKRPREEAVQMVFEAQDKGSIQCGAYSMEVAETKAAEAMEWARSHKYPLKCKPALN